MAIHRQIIKGIPKKSLFGPAHDCRPRRTALLCSVPAVLAMLAVLSVLPARECRARNYSSLLVDGLLGLGYPLSREDVVALDKISMRFDTVNRIGVLKRILGDRTRINAMPEGTEFEKTVVICSALRLLDELDLPVVRRMVGDLLGENSWRPKERRLLAYMAAKRNIDFETHTGFLIAALTGRRKRYDPENGRTDPLSILDTCDNLSFLTELYVLRGDHRILDALVDYAGRAYGYPKEYLSHMFTEILFQRPALFIDTISDREERKLRPVVNSLLFVIMQNNLQDRVRQLLAGELADRGQDRNRVVNMLREGLNRYENDTSDNRQQPAH